MADQPTEIGIARKARDAAAEADLLRAENARLVEQLDALRSDVKSIDVAPRGEHCYRCVAVYVDAVSRTVSCQRCGKALDAIDVLHEYAVRERNFMHANEHAKRELAQLRTQAEALKRDVSTAHAIKTRTECPRGCGASVAASASHPHGVAPHACYKRRADRGLAPRGPDTRWRVIGDDGPATRWCSQLAAMRHATEHGGRVEEYTGPIGDKAERAVDRAAFEAEWRARMEASRG